MISPSEGEASEMRCDALFRRGGMCNAQSAKVLLPVWWAPGGRGGGLVPLCINSRKNHPGLTSAAPPRRCFTAAFSFLTCLPFSR